MPEPMRVVIADDDFTCRCWLRGLLKKLGFSVVAEAANGQDAIAAVMRAKPDLVLLDVSMPVLTGPKALPQILQAHPGVQVVMLTSVADTETVTECLEKGAAGYLRKDSRVEQIRRHLVTVSEQIAPHPDPGGTHA